MLHSEIRMSPERVFRIIVACFALHNIAVKFKEYGGRGLPTKNSHIFV